MSTLVCAETNAVVKLDLGDNGGTRRIVFSRLWDSEKSQVSFRRLVNAAFRHSTLLRPDLHSAIVTYTDVDGDTITISTPHELQEAFEQFIAQPSNTGVTPVVLRAQVTFVREKGLKRKCMANVAMQRNTEDNSEEKSSEDKSSEDKSSEDKIMTNLDTNKRGRNCAKWVQMKHALDSLVTNMTETVEKLAKDYDDGNNTNLEMKAMVGLLVTDMKATVEKLTEDVSSIQPRKRIGVSIDDVMDTSNSDNPFNKANGRKRRNLKMQGMLTSFVTDMTETIEKLSDLVEDRNGDDADNAINEDVTEVVMAEKVTVAKEVGKTETSGSADDHTPSANDGTRDVDMVSNAWEVLP